MSKSHDRLKHAERLSRQTRKHRTHLNHIQDQKLQQKLEDLADQYEKTIRHSKTDRTFEQQRQQLLSVTVQQIANEHPSLKPTKKTRPESSPRISCDLFSHDCQLYPCQPIYHYRSFIKKEHDQTLRIRHPSNEDFKPICSPLQNLRTNIEEKKYQLNRRQLVLTMHNQYRLANRYVNLKRTNERLDEQSRLLRERLTDKKKFAYVKESHYEIKQAIQRHLEISAKFCA